MNAEKKWMQTVTANVNQPIRVMKYEKSDLLENDWLVCLSCPNPTHPGLLHTHCIKREIIIWVEEPKKAVLAFLFHFFVWIIKLEFTSVTGVLTENSLFPMNYFCLGKSELRGWQTVNNEMLWLIKFVENWNFAFILDSNFSRISFF